MVSLPVRGLLGSAGRKVTPMVVVFLAGIFSLGLTTKAGLSTLCTAGGAVQLGEG